jgi:hypothetical protein
MFVDYAGTTLEVMDGTTGDKWLSLPDFYSGCATGISGRFTEGLLLRRFQRRK